MGGGSTPGIGSRVFFIAFGPVLEPTQPFIQWIQEFFSRGLKWPGREAEYAPPAVAEVMNSGSTTILSHVVSYCGA
jgi:hypothetical protein